MHFLLYLLIFISFTDLFAQLPITSTYAQSLGAATGFIGFIVGAYSLTNLFSNVFAGHFVDNNGPKKVMIVGFLLNGIILFLYSVVTSPVQLLFARFLNGITAGVITPAAFTYITLYNKDKKSGKTMAYAGAAVGLAAICAPAFSGIISSKAGPEIVFVTLAVLMILGGLLTLLLKPLHKVQKAAEKKDSSLIDYFLLFKNKGLIISFVGALSLAASQGILAYMLPLKVTSLQMEDHISGMLMSIFGIVAILIFVLPTNRVFDRYQSHNVLAIGLLFVAFSQTFSSLVNSLPLLIISMCIYGVGFAFIFPSMSALISEHSTTNTRGKAFGLFYGFFSLGSFLGSSITGMFSLTPDQGFVSIAIYLIIVCMLIFLVVGKTNVDHAK